METFLRDVTYALRVLVRAPGFAATAILTFALGIGATAAVFSVIDTVLLRPLPFPSSDQLVQVTQEQGASGQTSIAAARLEDWNELSSTFDAITGYYVEDVSDTTGDIPERIRRAAVAPRFVELWGVAPAVGRGFTAEEHRAGSAVLISDRYWRTRLASNPDVLKQSVRIANRAFTIVGVMPSSFAFLDRDVDLWTPVTADPKVIPRRVAWYTGVGRLKDGVSVAQAEANLNVVQAQLAQRFPETDRDISVRVTPLQEAIVGGVRGSLWLLLAAVAVLLLIACTNIAALLLSRSTQREHEIAISFSLGASRSRVVRQALTETLLLALAGAAVAVPLAEGISAAFRAIAPSFPRLDEVAIDWRVVAFAFLTALVVAFVSGIIPAIRSTRPAVQNVRTQVSPRHTIQWVLVGMQVALSVSLLTSAGLLLRSFDRLASVDPGFQPASVLTFRISGGYVEVANYERLLLRINTAIAELGALPQVESAATAGVLPGTGSQTQSEFVLAEGSADATLIAESRSVSPSYFDTLGIPHVGGDACRQVTDMKAPRELLVNRSFAERYLAGRSPYGLNLRSEGGASGKIVGVVADAREVGLDQAPVPTVYSCFSAPTPTPYFLLRINGDPMALAATIRLKVKQLEPTRSVYDIAPLEQRIGDSFAQNRLRTILLVIFAAASLALACLGVYGTLNYMIALRRREIGLLLAIGATQARVVKRFLREVLSVVGIACLVGLLLLLGFARVLAGMLYGVTPADPLTLTSVIALIAFVATLAALIPSLRAASIDPMTTLREE